MYFKVPVEYIRATDVFVFQFLYIPLFLYPGVCLVEGDELPVQYQLVVFILPDLIFSFELWNLDHSDHSLRSDIREVRAPREMV